MSIPDAPWVGKCKEDYCGYGEPEHFFCEYCGKEYDEEEYELIRHNGDCMCRRCYESYYSEEGEEDEDHD